MIREEYEVRRQALEEQYRADVVLLSAAHGLRLRSLERLWRGAVEGEQDAVVPEAPATTVHEPVPAAPDPSPPPVRARHSVLSDLEAAFPDVSGAARQALALSCHFGTFTPFTVSQRANDSSPMKAGSRIRREARGGERISAKLLMR
jgi:hypothetical protein